MKYSLSHIDSSTSLPGFYVKIKWGPHYLNFRIWEKGGKPKVLRLISLHKVKPGLFVDAESIKYFAVHTIEISRQEIKYLI